MHPPADDPPIRPTSIIAGGSSLERLALRALQLGSLAVVLVAVADKTFELDRFFTPKELVLHVTALIAGLLAMTAIRRVAFTWVDGCLTAYLLLGLASTLFAEDSELAQRALTISASGVLVFWTARALGAVGLARSLLAALTLAAVVGAATALLQAYGVQTHYFSVNRAPGGSLGNRNFVAHMAAFALPLVLVVALRAWRTAGYAIASIGVAILTASLVLTRSRAGWLAFVVAMVVFVASMLASRPLRQHTRTWARLGGVVALVAAGAAAALLVPNSLRWRSENPYLESVTGIVNYQEGSGAGRLVQYGRSLRMAADHPLVGVGPGNWAVEYPDYAARNDPSLSRGNRRATANPWPSSDWVAIAAERGFIAVALLATALLGIAGASVRRLFRARDADEGLTSAALVATISATLVAGLFDAVLLLALPTLVVWAAVGALSPHDPVAASARQGRIAGILVVLLALAAGLGAAGSIMKLSTMEIVAIMATPR